MNEEKTEVRMRNVEDTLARIEMKLDTVLTASLDHEARLRALEYKPAKQWEALVGQIIAAIVFAVIGFLIAKGGI